MTCMGGVQSALGYSDSKLIRSNTGAEDEDALHFSGLRPLPSLLNLWPGCDPTTRDALWLIKPWPHSCGPIERMREAVLL